MATWMHSQAYHDPFALLTPLVVGHVLRTEPCFAFRVAPYPSLHSERPGFFRWWCCGFAVASDRGNTPFEYKP